MHLYGKPDYQQGLIEEQVIVRKKMSWGVLMSYP